MVIELLPEALKVCVTLVEGDSELDCSSETVSDTDLLAVSSVVKLVDTDIDGETDFDSLHISDTVELNAGVVVNEVDMEKLCETTV